MASGFILPSQEIPIEHAGPHENVEVAFEVYDARNNLVGVFDLLLKIDKRLNPDNYGFPLRNQYD